MSQSNTSIESKTRILNDLDKINVNKKIKVRYRKLNDDKYSLYFDLYINGKRKREFLQLYLYGDRKHYSEDKETLIYVQSLRDEKEINLIQKGHNFQLVNKSLKIDFIGYFNKLSSSKNRKWNTSLKHFSNFAKENNLNISFQDIDRNLCEYYAEYLKGKMAPKTARTHYIIFKAVLNKAVKDDIINRNPGLDISIKGESKKREFLTYEELRKLYETDCDKDLVKNAFLFSCWTGLRFSDVEKLKFSDVVNNSIIIQQKKTNDIVSIPLHENAKKILSKQRNISNGQDYIFRGLKSSWANVCISKWAIKAGINKHITFHIARHTYATLLLTFGVDIYTVSKLLGHKDVKTTQVYAQLVDKKREEAIDKLPRIKL